MLLHPEELTFKTKKSMSSVQIFIRKSNKDADGNICTFSMF